MAQQPIVIVRKWAIGMILVKVEGGERAFAKRFRARRYSKALGYAVGLARTLGIPLRDQTGGCSDADCAQLVAMSVQLDS
ncbi:hypothetical protein [Porphyrobacter sp. LM 6]|uniref:hypothetical protein n=1 Tax=Porphyrobacter sp. LM 6 TaxID=1896196 RepID=UPI000846EDD1|nr:hypothetical protein [Porphyrobacter sp. LM 6]AOL94670.1 hypothetical protein BG023_111745 [Porphyrobacter sp. LM 6]